jgi:hypothetical protein
MNRTLQLTATVSGGVPAPRDGRELTDSEVADFAREAAEAALVRCFNRCEKVAVKVTATVKEGGQ